MQLDLFPPPVAAPVAFDWEQREGWERRALRDMAEAPLVYCFPGFMGAVCERVVAKGWASSEPAGSMPPPAGASAKFIKVWRAEDHPQFRYAITAAGRAILEAERAA